jgi:hypothetical protein
MLKTAAGAVAATAATKLPAPTLSDIELDLLESADPNVDCKRTFDGEGNVSKLIYSMEARGLVEKHYKGYGHWFGGGQLTLFRLTRAGLAELQRHRPGFEPAPKNDRFSKGLPSKETA